MTPPDLAYVDEAAAARLLAALRAGGGLLEERAHEPPRHARHLAALWQAPLAQAGRATLLAADGQPLLALLPADRKIGAPRLRDLLGAGELRVLRGDRGVGRLGWRELPGEPGALPAVPEMYRAQPIVDQLVLALPRLIIALGGGTSAAVLPERYVTLTGARVLRFAGTTRLLPQGGMVEDPPWPAG